VLVVDDDDDIREIAVASLELTRDWAVVSACDGKEALSVAREVKPDAILLDVMMPDMDGPSVVRSLDENPSTRAIPVILLTAKVQFHDRHRYLREGVEGVIAKPFDPLQLADTVSEILHWP
jgi:CheY-like chemotaxis protein